MNNLRRNFLFFLVVLVLGAIILLPGVNDGQVNFTIRVISYINAILLVTSLICVTQFFWPKEINRTPFHVFNMIFVVVFYSFSLGFLLRHKDYYEGYMHLSNADAVMHFAMRWDIFSIMFWFIAFTFVLNIIYVMRHKKAYLQYN